MLASRSACEVRLDLFGLCLATLKEQTPNALLQAFIQDFPPYVKNSISRLSTENIKYCLFYLTPVVAQKK
jgi:hypothetical protein